MRDWTTPPFDTLPTSTDSRFRWAGSRLVTEEQYRAEGWERSRGYWRISIEGCVAYGALKASRRAERKEAWQARQEADDEWSEHVASLVDGGAPW